MVTSTIRSSRPKSLPVNTRVIPDPEVGPVAGLTSTIVGTAYDTQGAGADASAGVQEGGREELCLATRTMNARSRPMPGAVVTRMWVWFTAVKDVGVYSTPVGP
jgi:hypothetical protein